MKFVDDFIDYCRDFTGCPEVFLRWSALLALSAVAGENKILRRGDWDVRPNLWVLMIGNSSSYKSTGLSSVRRLLHELVPGILASQEYSHEALIEDIAQNPHRLFLYDEAESYFRMLAQKYNAPMRSAMMSLYNNIPIKRQIKGKSGAGEIYSIDHSYVCWGGASTPFQISAQLNGSTTDFLSGMFPRFLMVSYFGTEKTVEDPPPANLKKRSALMNTLRDLSLVGEREYTYTPEALDAKSKWLAQFNKRANSSEQLLSAFYRKLRDEHFHKLAMLSAFERGVTKLSIQDVAEASTYLWPIEKEWGSLIERLTEKEWDRDAKRVSAYLKTNGRASRSEIINGVRGIKAQKLSAILDGFLQDNQISITKDATDTLKPKTIITWLDL